MKKNVHKCPKCKSPKGKFLSDVAAWRIPWAPHKDVNGVLHKHDPNKHFVDYKCKCGHIFEESYFPECNVCCWQASNY